jgi:selenocysteine-specific elongation factor
VAEREHRSGVARGDVITLPSLGSAHDTLDVVISCSGRESSGDRPLRNGQKVVWHHGSAGIEARIYLQGVRQLESGSSAPAQLRFRGKVYAFTGDRFVLRDVARQRTLAGGVIIDPEAGRAHFRKPKFRACLETCAAAVADPAVLMAALVTRDGARLRESLLLKSRWSAAELEAAAGSLIKAGTMRAEGPWLIDCAWWENQVAAAGNLVRTWHRARPELPGLDAAEFQSQASTLLPDKRLLEPLTVSLAAIGFIRSGRHFRHVAHRPALPPQLQAAGARLRAALARNPVEPPGVAELITSPLDRQALKFLTDTGEAVQLDEKAVLLSDALESLRGIITTHLARTGGATASDLRVVTGTTRRILIPLLERMDREGVTRRDGDFRRLRQVPPPSQS